MHSNYCDYLRVSSCVPELFSNCHQLLSEVPLLLLPKIGISQVGQVIRKRRHELIFLFLCGKCYVITQRHLH